MTTDDYNGDNRCAEQLDNNILGMQLHSTTAMHMNNDDKADTMIQPVITLHYK